MPHKFRFNHFDLGQLTQFAPNQEIEFDPIMTAIIGANGIGKTRLVRALRQHFIECYGTSNALNPAIIPWLIFPSIEDIPTPGEAWLPLQEWLSTQVNPSATSDAVGELATRYWQSTMAPMDGRILHLSVRISTEGNIDVWMPAGDSTANQSYSGMSDRIILGLCIRLAVRNFQGLDVPIVVDDIGNCLSNFRVDQLIWLLRLHTPQSVITGNTLLTIKRMPGKLVLLQADPEGIIVDASSLNHDHQDAHPST